MRDHSRNATKKVPEGGGTHHMQTEEGESIKSKSQKCQLYGGGDPPHASCIKPYCWRGEESTKSKYKKCQRYRGDDPPYERCMSLWIVEASHQIRETPGLLCPDSITNSITAEKGKMGVTYNMRDEWHPWPIMTKHKLYIFLSFPQ